MRNSVFRLLHIAHLLALFSFFLPAQQLFFENGLPSRPSVLYYASSTRTIIDLAGRWECSLDDGKMWRQVSVPSSYTGVGKVIFLRKFLVESELLTRSSFKFVAYGINYSAEIYINDVFIGKHEGGYTSFSLTIPENTLQVGKENVIRVVTDNTLDAKSTLPLRQQIGGWKNYGGILRDIFLVATPRVWIDNVSVTTESIDPKGVQLAVRTTLFAKEVPVLPTISFVYAVEVIEKKSGAVVGKTILPIVTPEPNKDVTTNIFVTISGITMWSPETPELYTVKVSLQKNDAKNIFLVDEYTTTTGIRTLAKEKDKLLFNGVPLTIRAVAWMEDSYKHGGSPTYEEMEKDIALIKNLGANAIRIAFHPPHPFVIELCNQYGVLVLEEIPLYEVPQKILAEESYRALTENYLREMIQRDKNQPSIIAWGFGEGLQQSDEPEKSIIAQLQRVARVLDNRLTYYVTRLETDIDQSNIVDIAAIAINTADIKQFKSTLQDWKEAHPNQPVLVGRFGKEIEIGNRNGYSDPMSQEAQAQFLLRRINAIKEIGIAGSVVWAFADWRGDRPILSVKSQSPDIATSGIIELNREKKVSYDIVRSLFLGEKTTALPLGASSHSSPIAYVLIGLFILIVFAWLLNSNRRFRESVDRSLFRPYNFFADIRDRRILSSLHTAIIVVIVAITLSIVLSSIVYHYRMNVLFDYALSYLVSSDTWKMFFIRIAWNPLLSILYCSVVALVLLLVTTIAVQFFAFTVRSKVSAFHSYSIAVWSALPVVFFIPLGMILYRVMENSSYVIPVLALVCAVMVWIFFRTLKGVSVIYDVSLLRVYVSVSVVVLSVGVGVFWYFNHAYAVAAYLDFFFNAIVPAYHN